MNSSMGAMDPRSLRRGTERRLQNMRRWLVNRIHEARFIRWRELEESLVHDLRTVEAELLALEGQAA